MDNAFELGSILDEVNKKFEEAENAIETKLQKITRDEIAWKTEYGKSNENIFAKNERINCTRLEEAKQRNANLLRELEIAKARLRSRSTFSPLEMELKKAISNYLQKHKE